MAPPHRAFAESDEASEDHDLQEDGTSGDEEVSDESTAPDDGPDYLEIWVVEGNWEHAAHFAFVEIEPPTAAANPTPLIYTAFNIAAPQLRFQILLSSCGLALLHFGSAVAWEAGMLVQPIHVNGTTIRLERVEETDDRFIREPA